GGGGWGGGGSVVWAGGAVRGLPEGALEPIACRVERLVEVLGAGFAAYHGPASTAGDLDVLAAAVLPPVAFVMQLHVGTDDLLVVPFDLPELLGDVYPEMLWDLDVAPVHHHVHAPSTVGLSVQPHRARQASSVDHARSEGSPTRSGHAHASWESRATQCALRVSGPRPVVTSAGHPQGPQRQRRAILTGGGHVPTRPGSRRWSRCRPRSLPPSPAPRDAPPWHRRGSPAAHPRRAQPSRAPHERGAAPG